MKEKSVPTSLEKTSMQYGDQTTIRAIIQAIPYVGGSLDTLLVGGGQKWKEERAEHFFNEVESRFRALESAPKIHELKNSEELHDLIYFSLEQALKTRSKDKRRRFANIISSQIIEPDKWEHAEAAARLLAGLTDLDVLLLGFAAAAPVCGAPFDGQRIVELDQPVSDRNRPSRETFKPVNFSAAAPSASPTVIRMSCAELIAKGLLADEGVGGWDSSAMQFFASTESATWFLDWISD